MNASKFFSKEQQSQILDAIREAEDSTSGEIRVHIESESAGDTLDRAAWIFKKIGMVKTADRNGVLFYLALVPRKFAIIGDAGINTVVPKGFWDEIKEVMQRHFREGEFADGLVKGILMAGDKLKEHFPYQERDKNELPDEISFGDPV